MNYIYDILINLQRKLYDFYEWNVSDDITHVRKIPIFKIRTAQLLDLKNNKVVLNSSLLKRISNRTEIFTNHNVKGVSSNIEVVNGKYQIAVDLLVSDLLEDSTLKFVYSVINGYRCGVSNDKVYTITTDDGEMQFSCETVNEIALDAVDSFVGLVSDFIEENASTLVDNLRIYLTGGGLSYLRGIKSHLSARLGSPVEILVPKVPMHAKPDESSVFAMLNFALNDRENR